MSTRNIVQGAFGLAGIVCALVFSLLASGSVYAASRSSIAPNVICSNPDWYYVTSDTKNQTYTYTYPGVGSVSLTLQVHVELQALIGDNGNCGRMRSALSISKVSCSSSNIQACNVYGTAQAYFVTTSGQRIYSSTVKGNAGASGSISAATYGVLAQAGAAGGTWAVSGYSTVQVGTAQE